MIKEVRRKYREKGKIKVKIYSKEGRGKAKGYMRSK
jgi:hypothetical protein